MFALAVALWFSIATVRGARLYYSEQTCCSSLIAALPDSVFAANISAQYESSLASYWTLEEQSLRPACIVIPSTSSEVSKAVGILSQSHCKFAIRSGGHTPFAGAANIDNGVTIDLTKLSSVTISGDRSTAHVGPGARWGEVYSTLQAQNFTVPGGRDPTVGVGGFITGGGISFYSPRVGLVCDAVTNFEVVLASGAIVNANATSNKMLFRALKGGSNNFGVVTRIDLPLIPTGPIWGGFLTTDQAFRPTASAFFENFTNSTNADPFASHIQTNAFVNGSWILLLHMAYTQPGSNDPAIFEPLLELPGQKTTQQATHLELTEQLAGEPNNTRTFWMTLTQKNDAAFMDTFFQMTNETTAPLANITGLFVALSFQPLSQTTIQHNKDNGGDALGLDAEDGDLVIVNLGIFWENIEDDDRIYSAIGKLFEDGTQKAKEMGAWNEYIYLNYALRHGEQTQNVIAGYGNESILFLNEVSKEYDPTGVFQVDVPGGFKLLM